MQNKKATASPAVVNTKALSQHNVQINQLMNPHQKLEGIQKVNKEDIKKLVDKAQRLPIQQPGDFVKVQSYEFTVDEVSDDEGESKMTSSKMGQSKMSEKQKKGKKQDKKEVKIIDSTKPPKIVPKIPETKQSKLLKELAKLKKTKKEKPNEEEEIENIVVDIKSTKHNEQDQQIISEDGKQEQQVNSEEEKEPKDEYQEEFENEENQEDEEDIQMEESLSQGQVSKVSEKKFQSSMARLMEEMIGESIVETEQKQDETYDIPGFEEQQKQYMKTIKQYQRKIKQLNNQLNEIQQPPELPVIVEQPELLLDNKKNKEDSHINIYQEFIQHSEIEKQFKNLKQSEEAKIIEYENKIQQQQIQMEILEIQNKERLTEMEKQYAAKMKNMQQKVKRYESLALNQIHKNKIQQNEEILSLMSSNISALVQDKDLYECDYNIDPEKIIDEINNEQKKIEKKLKIEEADIQSEFQSVTSGVESVFTKRELSEFNKQIKIKKQEVQFNESSIGDVINQEDHFDFHNKLSQMSSSIEQFQKGRKNQIDTDSNISGLIADDSELFIQYQKIQPINFEEQLIPRSPNKQRLELDSNIDELIDKTEVEDLLKQDNYSKIDSNLSVSDIISLDKVTRILKENKKCIYDQINSDIGSLISQDEIELLKQDPLYSQIESQELVKDVYDSVISSIISEKEKEWLQDQDIYDELNSDVDSNNGDFNVDKNSSFYLKLAEQLERDYYVPKGEKLDIYRKIMLRAKQQYMDKLKIKIKQPQPKKLAKTSRDISYISCEIKSDINSSINSVISKTEQLDFEKMKTQRQNEQLKCNETDKFEDINSSIGSIISKNSQQILQNDSQMKLINSQITEQKNQSLNHSISNVSDISKQSANQSNGSQESQKSQSSKNSIFNFLSYKRDTINNLSKQGRKQFE